MAKNTPKKPTRPRVAVPLTDIEEEFRAQLQFLTSSCDAYDVGNRDEFRRIALAIRILLHDHGQSKSVAEQLGLKAIPFTAFSRPVDPTNLMSEMPLVVMLTGPEASYLPALGEVPSEARQLSFTDWWNEEAFRSPKGVAMSRSGFILHTTNQAGGAHVDSELDEEFYKIAKQNEGGWRIVTTTPDNIVSVKPLLDIEKAYVRHIGYEVLHALNPEWKRIRGNQFCECGSGKKYRYCHGKAG